MATYVYDFATTGCGLRPPSKAALLKAQGEKASQQKIVLRGIGTYQFYVGAKAAYIHAIMAPVLLMAVGVLLATIVQKYTLIDAIYWVAVTFTTVGYGDLVPDTTPERIYTMALMCIATTSVGATISRYSSISAPIIIISPQSPFLVALLSDLLHSLLPFPSSTYLPQVREALGRTAHPQDELPTQADDVDERLRVESQHGRPGDHRGGLHPENAGRFWLDR